MATSAPTFGAPNGSGVVTGSLNVVDPDGNTLSYSITQPASGTVAVTSGGNFTYTPKGTAQLAAYASEGDDFETFTVTVSDGFGGSKTVTVSNVVIKPSIAALTGQINYSGELESGAVKGPDNKYYMTIDGGTAGTRVVVIDPADADNPTVVDAEGQNAFGGVVWGSDGKAYQSGYTTTNGVDHSYVTVIDPNDLTHPVVIDAGAGRPSNSLQNGPDGNVYLTTASSADNTVRVVRINPASPTTPTIAEVGPGNTYSNIQFAADGNLYLTTYTVAGNASGYTDYTTRVVRIDPNNFTQPTVITAGTGYPADRADVLSDGTVFQVSYTYAYVNNNYVYTPQVAVITPQNPNQARVATLPSGVNYYNVNPIDLKVGPEGHLFVRTYHYDYNNGASTYTNWVTVFDPQNQQAPTTLTLPGDNYSSNIAFGPDGTAYATSYDYNNGYVNYVTVIDPNNPAQAATVTLPGTASFQTNNLRFAPDGTAYALTYTPTTSGSSTTYTNYVTVIDPQDPAHPTVNNLSNVTTSSLSVVGAGSTGVWLRGTNAAGQNLAIHFDPNSPASATTAILPGTNVASQVVATDGTLYTVHYNYNSSTGQNTNWGVTVLDAEAPTTPATINLANSPGSGIVTGAGGAAYLTAGTTVVSGQTTTQVLVFKPSDPTHPVTVPIAGTYTEGVYVTQDGRAVQVVRNAANNVVTLAVISPNDLANPVKITYPGTFYSDTTGPDGKHYMTLNGGSGTRVVVMDLANPTNPTLVNAGSQVGAQNPYGGVVFGADGKAYQTSYSTVGNVNHTYVTVIDPANLANPVLVDAGDGRPTNSLQRGPDGNFYLTNAFTTDGTIRVVRINPANLTNPAIVNAGPGTTYSNIRFASDGKMYLTTYTGTTSANGYTDFTTRVVRMDPNNFTQPTVITAGPGSPYGTTEVFSDGTVTQLSYTYATVSGVTTYTPYLTVVTPQNPNQALVAKLPATTSISPDVYQVTYAPDGTIYAQTVNRVGSVYTNYVTVINPQNPAQPTTVTLPNTGTNSSFSNLTFGPDGKAYVASYSYNNGYTNYLTVIDPQNPAQAVSATLPGNEYAFYDNLRAYGPDGTAYLISRTYNGSTGYTNYLTIVGPQTPQPVTVTLPGTQYSYNSSVAVASDGTAYAITSDYNNTTGAYTNYLTIVDPQDAANPVTTNLSGLTTSSVSIIAAGDDQVLLNATVSGNAAIVLVHLDDPSNPTVISSVGSPYGETVTGADGVLYRTSYSYENGYKTRVLVVHPSDPTGAAVITLDGYPAGSLIIGADGQVVQPVYAGNIEFGRQVGDHPDGGCELRIALIVSRSPHVMHGDFAQGPAHDDLPGCTLREILLSCAEHFPDHLRVALHAARRTEVVRLARSRHRCRSPHLVAAGRKRDAEAPMSSTRWSIPCEALPDHHSLR